MELSKTIEPIQWCEVTETGLTIPDNMPFDQWVAVGEAIQSVRERCLWYLGDWLLAGVKRYGDKAKLAATEGAKTGYSVSTCMNAMHVSSLIQDFRRLKSLSWSHHQVVANITEEEQREWLKTAEDNKWTVSELRMAVRQDRKLLDDGSGDGEPITYSPALWLDAMRPIRQMENDKPIEQWPQGQRESVMRMVWPAVEFYNRLNAIAK